MASVPRRFRMYVACVLGSAGLLLLPAMFERNGLRSGLLLVFLVSALISENLAVPLPNGGTTSISYPIFLAATLLMGPVGGSLVAAASGFNLHDIRVRRSPWIIAFNISQFVVVVLLSARLYVALGGYWLEARSSLHGLPQIAFPLVAIVLVSSTLNDVLVTIGISLHSRSRFRQAWASGASWLLPIQIALGTFGVALAYVTAIAPLSLFLVVFPLLLSRQIYQQYLELRSAYPASAKSLVRALEVKDTYTRGHAERVSRYCVVIAEEMGLTRHATERLELAALLHDVGKIAVERGILKKPVKLTSDERDRIRQHPVLGADMLSRVAYLADLVPVVRYHHEWVDGSGYGMGLRGGEIPLEARILAVGDAYDAMTSDRAYREAIGHDEAVREIRLCSGTQFDGTVVEALERRSQVIRRIRFETGESSHDGVADAGS